MAARASGSISALLGGGFAVIATAISLPLTVACRPSSTPTPDPTPGEPFIVTGALVSNGCAPGLNPENPMAFEVEIRRADGIAYWRIGTQPWVPGTLDRSGNFHFTVRSDVEVYPPTRGTDPELDPGTAGCALAIVESIDGRMFSSPTSDAGDTALTDAPPTQDASALGDASDAGSAPAATFEAENRIELVPHAGSDCSRALLSAGGAFPTLPCTATYELDGASR